VEEDIENYERLLSHHEQVVSSLKSRLSTLREWNLRFGYLKSAFRRMPAELWREIFSLCCSEQAGQEPGGFPLDMTASILSSVCIRWRDIVHSSPVIWSFLSLDLSDALISSKATETQVISLTKSQIQHCGEHVPLHLHLYFPHESYGEYIASIYEILEPTLDRWRTLSISGFSIGQNFNLAPLARNAILRTLECRSCTDTTTFRLLTWCASVTQVIVFEPREATERELEQEGEVEDGEYLTMPNVAKLSVIEGATEQCVTYDIIERLILPSLSSLHLQTTRSYHAELFLLGLAILVEDSRCANQLTTLSVDIPPAGLSDEWLLNILDDAVNLKSLRLGGRHHVPFDMLKEFFDSPSDSEVGTADSLYGCSRRWPRLSELNISIESDDLGFMLSVIEQHHTLPQRVLEEVVIDIRSDSWSFSESSRPVPTGLTRERTKTIQRLNKEGLKIRLDSKQWSECIKDFMACP
jgi:hypothetical protein